MLNIYRNLKQHINSRDKGILILLVTYLFTVALGLTPWVYSDGAADYSWVRSAFMDGNLDCTDEYVHFVNDFMENYGWPGASNDLYPVKTSTGYQANKYPIGTAILWSPFFLIGHVITILSNAILGTSIALDGYSKYYIFFVTLGSTLYAFFGLIFSYKLCRKFFSESVSLISTLAIWFASSIPVYMYLYPSLPHNMSLFTVSAFFLYWYSTIGKRSNRQWMILGALGGFIFLTRLENAVLLIIPVIELVDSLRKQRIKKDNLSFSLFGKNLGYYTIFGFLFSFPQFYVWKVIFGKWFLNPYSQMHRIIEFDKASKFGIDIPINSIDASSGISSYTKFISHPDIFATLFGSSYGIFTWTPILLLSVVGLYFLIKKNPQFGFYVLLGLALLVYITSCSKKQGMSFGDRYLIKAAPFFIIGLAALIDKIKPRFKTKGLYVLLSIFVVWNSLFIVQYSTGLINRQGPISWKVMITNQFTEAPIYFLQKAKPFLVGRNSAYKGNNQNK